MDRLDIGGAAFAQLVREALEAEYGGEVDTLLNGFGRQTLENPERFAVELFEALGTEALQYYVTIVKYAESGNYQPGGDAQKEEEELESLVHKIESDEGQNSGET